MEDTEWAINATNLECDYRKKTIVGQLLCMHSRGGSDCNYKDCPLKVIK